MQQAEMEMVRHQEANLTALAAIGPRKKRKIEDMAQVCCEVSLTVHIYVMKPVKFSF